MSRPLKARENFLVCFPRVSGDEPAARVLVELALLFSPRERG